MEHGHGLRRREGAGEDDDMRFWYFRNRFDLMERFLDDLEGPSEPLAVVRRRFLQAVHHAKRVLVARNVVTFLLMLGVVATAAAAIAEAVWVPNTLESGVASTSQLLARAAAVTGSASVVLLGLRLAFDRYLRLVETCATFLAMQVASSTARRPT